MKKFNQQTPDVDGIKYFSWGAVYEPGLIDTWKYVKSFLPVPSSSTLTRYRWPHSVILEKEGPNDGLVSVDSAKWVHIPDLTPKILICNGSMFREHTLAL